MDIERGETLALDDNKEYIVLATANDGANDYLYLLGNFKPATVKFALVKGLNNDDLKLEIVNNREQKMKLLKLFHQNH